MNVNLLSKIEKKIGQNRLFYVCRDIERAETLLNLCTKLTTRTKNPNNTNLIKIITNKSPRSTELKRKHKDHIIIIESKKKLDTWEILKQIQENNLIKQNDFVMVFKNTKHIEKMIQKNGWKLINPSAKIASTAEEKLSQINWLGKIKSYLPGYDIKEVKNIKFIGKKFIIQFNYSHTGSGTILIESDKQLKDLQQKFPNRLARIAKYIKGPLITNNNIIWDNKILTGNISYQITGLLPFTDKKFATFGNDWKLGSELLTEKQIAEYNKIVEAVGQNFIKDNWKGLFGIDVVMEEKTGKLYLLEINARQPASTSCESWLQVQENLKQVQSLPSTQLGDDKFLTTFEAHLASLLEIPYTNEKLIKIDNGAQVIQRVTSKTKKITAGKVTKLKQIFNIIKYNNKKDGSDLVRIQSEKGLMSKHNQFNNLGKEIIKTIIKI